MADPTELAMVALKRLRGYLGARPRLVCHLPWRETAQFDVCSDTGRPGCVKTGKSTSGECLVLGYQVDSAATMGISGGPTVMNTAGIFTHTHTVPADLIKSA